MSGQIFEFITISFCLFFHDSIVFLLDCNQPTLIGDGYCNDEVNILDCGYDGGDCCGSCINTDLCNNCSCLGNITGNGAPNPLVGDGYCNDETNTQQCNFDGGDCCLTNLNTDHCSICSCSQNGVVMSTGYPQYYLEDQDLTWLLQVPIGQNIKIVFISFDVGSSSNCKYVFLIVISEVSELSSALEL